MNEVNVDLRAKVDLSQMLFSINLDTKEKSAHVEVKV